MLKAPVGLTHDRMWLQLHHGSVHLFKEVEVLAIKVSVSPII